MEHTFKQFGPDVNIPEEVIEIINEGENEDFDLEDLEDI